MKTDVRRRHITRVTIGYGILAALWILLSDALLAQLPESAAMQWLSTVKGLLFVLVTTLLLYYALRGVPDRGETAPTLFEATRPAAAPWTGVWVYVFAVVATLATLVLRGAIPSAFADRPMMVLLLFPVIISAMAGGLGPGLVATFTAVLAVDFFFASPHGSLRIAKPLDLFHLSFLIADGVLVSVLSEILHRQRRQTEAGRQLQAVTLAAIGDGVITTDPAGCITFMNPEAERLTGWPGGEALGRPLAEVFRLGSEENRQPLPDPAATLLAAGRSEGFRNPSVLFTRAGLEVPIQASGAPISLADGILEGVVMIFRDDTQRRHSEAVVREERALFQDLLDAQPAGMFRLRVKAGQHWDPESFRASGAVPCAFEIFNGRFCELLEVAGRELVEDPGGFARRVHPEELAGFIAATEKVSAGSAPFSWEGRMLIGETVRWMSLEALPRRLDNGDLLWTGIMTDIGARKQSELALRESQTMFALLAGLLEKSAQPFSQGFPDGRLGFYNHAYLELTGYSAEESAHLNWRELTAPEWREQEEAQLAQLHATGQPVRYEKEYLRKDGSRVPIELLVHLARDEEGAPLYYYTFLTDLSERKKAEAALRESEKTYRSLFENSLNSVVHARVIFEADEPVDMEYLAVNPAFVKVTGISEKVVGRRISEVIPGYGRDNPESLEVFGRVASTGEATRWVHYLPALERWFSFSIYSPAPGEVIIVTDNITEQKKAELALRESEARLRAISDNLPDGYIFQCAPGADGRSRFLYISAGVTEIHGLTPDEVLADASLLYRQVDPAQIEALARAERQSHLDLTDFSFEVHVLRPDRSWRWLAVRSRPCRRPDGQLVWDGVATDITARKALEDQLFQAQKMESVGRLAGGVAHDFNNMLTVIGGHAELALSQTAPEDPRYSDLQEIRSATRRSANLTRQLLAFARKQTVNPQVLDLNDTLAAMLKMLQRLIGEDIDLAWVPGHQIWPVKIDPSQIDQLLANLAVNARDAIGGAGKITIETANHHLDADYCAAHPEVSPGDYVELAVSDSGGGMSGEVISHLFEPFFTTKAEGKGTGLGLATVYGIVKQNRGGINVYSEPGKGTTFRIYLPRHAAPAEAAAEPVVSPAPGGNETVLIVEDDPAILNLGQRFIGKLGYRILTAASPGEAIRLVEEGRPGRIDLLITDVVMPEMNGKELAARLKELLPGLKCLFMSGYTADAIARQGVLDEGITFLAKPFSSQEMAAKIRQALEQTG